MIIKSKFKDYYDYVGYIFGSDPKIVYERKPFVEDVFIKAPKSFPNYPVCNRVESGNQYFAWLCIAGKYHLLIEKLSAFQTSFELFDYNNKTHSKMFNGIDNRSYNNIPKNIEDFSKGIQNESIRIISEQVNSPVFIVSNGYDRDTEGNRLLHIHKNIPKLKEIGVPSIISAEQLYQDISYFICNTINESPDNMPITKMSDKEKVIQHGFDIKKSFRNRV